MATDANSGDGAEYMMLDFSRLETVHRWKKLPECQEFVGHKRSKHTIVAYKDALYVFGGDNGRTMLNDLLRFDVKDQSWSRAITPGVLPAPRYHHSAVVYKNSMIVFGGYTGDIHSNSNLTNKNDLHEYKFSSGQWQEWKVESCKPEARAAHGAAVYDDKLWIFAGYDGNTRLNDMWTISLKGDNLKWNKVNQNGEIPPTSCNFALTVARNSIFLFSGQSGAKITNDIYQFELEHKTWHRITTDHILQGAHPPPEKRFGHTMVAYDGHLYVFGGATGQNMPNDLYSFDLDTTTWRTINPTGDSEIPTGRLFHAAAVINDAMYVFGGTTDMNIRNGAIYRFQFSNYPRCTLRDDLDKLLKSKQFADVEFVLGEERIQAHQCMIAARSLFLRTKIRYAKSQQNLTEDGKLEVKLSDADPCAFKLVLSYIYTDRIKPSEYSSGGDCVLLLMMGVYRLAREFEMLRLSQLCIHFLEGCINHNNVLIALRNAASMDVEFLKEFCLRYIVRASNYSQIVFSEDIERIEKGLLIEIMRRQQSNMSRQLPEQHADMIYVTNSLEQDLEQFLSHGTEFCDVTLTLGDLEIPAHTPILGARSSYFEAQFRSFMPPDRTVKIAIGEMVPSREAFRSLLRYIYHGDVTMPPEDSLYLFSAPYYYGFSNSRLQTYCKQNLEMNVAPENVLEILEAAHQIQASDMKRHTLKIVVQNFTKVAKLPQLRKLSRELLLDIIDEVAQVAPQGLVPGMCKDLVALNLSNIPSGSPRL